MNQRFYEVVVIIRISLKLQKQLNIHYWVLSVNKVFDKTQLIFNNCKIVDKSDHWSLLLFKESLAIRRRKPELNHGA